MNRFQVRERVREWKWLWSSSSTIVQNVPEYSDVIQNLCHCSLVLLRPLFTDQSCLQCTQNLYLIWLRKIQSTNTLLLMHNSTLLQVPAASIAVSRAFSAAPVILRAGWFRTNYNRMTIGLLVTTSYCDKKLLASLRIGPALCHALKVSETLVSL